MKRKMPLIKNVMTPFPYSVEESARISEARDMMLEHSIRHLPVTRDHQIVGMISDRDISVVYSLGKHLMDADGFLVSMLCTPEPYTVDTEKDLATVALQMAERHIGSAIVTHHGHLAGICTTTDICQFLGEYLQELYGGGPEGPPEAA